MNKKEIDAINLQLFGLVLSLLTVIFSIVLTYNQKLKLEKKRTILNGVNALTLSYINRTLILIISLIFLIVNYRLYNISKKSGEDLKSYILQIIASYITIIASVIALYVVTLSKSENIVDVENPTI